MKLIISFVLAPKHNSTVIPCSCQYLSSWIPVHAENGLVVPFFDPMQETFLAAYLSCPKRYCALLRAACEKLFFVRVPCHNLNRIFLASINIDLLQLPKVVNFDVAIFATREEPVAINRVPAHTADHVM